MCTEKNNCMYYYLLYFIHVQLFVRDIGMDNDSSWEKNINGIKKERENRVR